MEVGERFELQSCVIEITRVRESLKAGADPLWIAEFTRHEQERYFHMRGAPPAHADHEEQGELDAFSIEKARIESAYSNSAHGSIDLEAEGVDPDWDDTGRAKREKERQEARKAAMSAERSDAEVDKAAATLKRVGKALGRNGVDLTDTLADIYARLAAAEKEAA